MNMRPDDFWDLTMRQFRLKQIGYSQAREESEINVWQVARWLGVLILKPHLKKGSTLKPKDLIELPTDKKLKQKEDQDSKRKKALFAKKKYEMLERQKHKKTVKRLI